MSDHPHIAWIDGEPYIKGTTVEPWRVYEYLGDHSREETAKLLGLTVDQVDVAEAFMLQTIKDVGEVWGI